MINQPFGSKPQWFTYRPAGNIAWHPGGWSATSNSAPRFSGPLPRSPSLQVRYYTEEMQEETIDLRNVVGWKTIPNSDEYFQYELETIVVFLSLASMKEVRLHNQKGNPEAKLAKWDGKNKGPVEKVTIPQPELTQIDDFFDAMLKAKLL